MKKASTARTPKEASVRQTVTMPARLAREVERVARKRHLTKSKALVELAERGLAAEVAAHDSLNETYRQFMAESNPRRKDQAGRELIRTIFGKDAIAEDSIL